MPRRLFRKPVTTAAAWWLTGAGLYAVAEPLWQAADFFVFLLAPPAVLAAYWLVAERRLSRRAGFTVAAGEFTNRPRRPVAALLVVAGHLAGPHLVAAASAHSTFDAAMSLLSAPLLGAPLIIGAIVTPRLVLSPTGLACRGAGYPLTSWDGLVGAELVTDGPRAGRGVRLTLLGPNGREWTETIPRGYDIDYTFLTAAIWHYLAHPEHRAAIGTDTELARLNSAVAVAGHFGEIPQAQPTA